MPRITCAFCGGSGSVGLDYCGKEGVPYNRVVYIESDDRNTLASFIWSRGTSLSSNRVLDVLNYPADLEQLVRDLTLASAWVCEGRALFPERLPPE